MSLPSKLLIRTTAPDGRDKPAIMRADTEMVLLASCDAVDCPAPPALDAWNTQRFWSDVSRVFVRMHRLMTRVDRL